MTLPELIMWATVLGVGLPAAWWNPTSGALVIAWLAGQGYYLVTGDNLPLEIYLFPDIAVIAIIMSKREDCTLAPYRSTLYQLRCLLLERSRADRVVLVIFPVAWILYVAAIHPYHKWMMLWALCVTQFLAAGWEALLSYRRDADAVSRHPEDTGHLLIAYRGRGYG